VKLNGFAHVDCEQEKASLLKLYTVRAHLLVQFRDRGCGGGDASVRTNYHKVAVGHLARSRIAPHENVYPVLIFPKSPDSEPRPSPGRISNSARLWL
jgi:hypothetical protein